jgi:endonuclease G
MNDPFQMQRELRYGAPVCDQILTGRYFTIGYSWYFRQAKWTLEIINRDRDLIVDDVDRMDNFRVDTRLPHRFRAGLRAYKDSGFDRGHLVGSANQDLREIQNSETFLLSNMSPQVPAFNRGKWAELEDAIRDMDGRKNADGEHMILETYVLTCPVFFFEREVKTIGSHNADHGINVPVPHAFVKSVLTEDRRGRHKLWTFMMENKALDGALGDYLVKTYDAEQIVGGRFWDRISGTDMHDMKRVAGKMWDLPGA